MRSRWPLPILALAVIGALGTLALHLAWWARRPARGLALPGALELAVVLAWLPAVLVFAARARRRFGSPFSPAVARAFYSLLFDGTPTWLKRTAIVCVTWAFVFLLARWLAQLGVPDAAPPAPGDPEMTAVACAFYVLSAAILTGEARRLAPGPRPV